MVDYFSFTESRLREKALSKATTDELTGLLNSRFLHQFLDNKDEYHFLIMIDIDNFKLVNDKFGHPAGDKLLKEIAVNFKQATRNGDILIRYGGDEFIILPKKVATKDQVLKLADRIRLALEKTCISFLSSYDTEFKKGIITASFGIAKNQNQDINNLIEEADKALYKAKAKGKNCIVYSQS